ncbi:HPr family phosphocarrier protein [Frisingicoccus caecimuris]|jgi:phosphocarrier protein HPr|uniref:PTS HPr component family protein n=1 Tax=Frisingicoccus caecimuris TaxID=1796636 RepID=A0A4R2LGC3_9FIRM|nr:HPr family phosphocarrier protein [Frisingicoccus caecimuris]MCR1919524.1 HPr family phosphocarrier protein [Frisingicoccus caecimuris]TCO83913.1 PTS HPr component family protein [Frisingicoccus caecimuris]
MKEATILLQSIEDVKEFNRIVAVYDGDVDLVSGRYVIDAKSIMGIFSLDLSKPINIQVHGDNPDSLIDSLKAFIQ